MLGLCGLVAVLLICSTILIYQHCNLIFKAHQASQRLSVYRLKLEKDLTSMVEQLAATQKALKRLAEFVAKNKNDAAKILADTEKT